MCCHAGMVLFGRHRTMKKNITLDRLKEPTSKVGRVLVWIPSKVENFSASCRRNVLADDVYKSSPILPLLSPTTFGPNVP
jgi:hypothetical protein